MIPKIIHYCWFGGNPLSDEYKGYIETWKKFCPDYEIREWNENNFDVNQNIYCKEAYEAKKWAFVSDYVRLYALSTVGGIYMDTDVEVLKNLDCFLNERGFSGFERIDAVPTGIMAAEMGHPFINELLHQYDNSHFLKEDNTFDMTTNVVKITETAKKYGLQLNNTKQTIQKFTFYPSDFFCPKSCRTFEINLTENTYTIHHFAGSWNTEKSFRRTIKKMLPIFMLKWITAFMDKLGIK